MSNYSVNLQDSFLNQVRKDGLEIELMLTNGVCFRGQVRGFDNFTVIIQVESAQHLVYKHAIAQIISKRAVRYNVHDEKPRDEAAPVPAPEQGAAPAEDKGSEHEHRHKSRHARPGGAKRPPKEAREDENEKDSKRFNTLDLSHIKLT